MSTPPRTISSRKQDHLRLCAEGDVGFRAQGTLLDQVGLVHQALPELAFDEVDVSVTFLGKPLRAPLVIAAMTGGTDEAKEVNMALAGLAEELGVAFGLGSQRAMWKDPSTTPSFAVRGAMPTMPLLGNIGVVQARELSSGAVAELAGAVGADAICVHINPAMELVQDGGDRDFRGALETLARLARELPIPVIGKETGSGLSREAGAALRRVGIEHVDVSGAGGTSWVGVEAERAKERGDTPGHAIGEALWDWGIPTAASVAFMAPLGFKSLIATGGIKSGYDVARALALGADIVGIARPVLMALKQGGIDGARRFVRGVIRELTSVMLLSGARDFASLRKAPRRIGPELQSWLSLP
jgi:isopentenyl-diphosphate delta-isomerase